MLLNTLAMHVLLKGIAPNTIVLLPYRCIYEKKLFGLQVLSNGLSNLTYSYMDAWYEPDKNECKDIAIKFA